MQDFESIDWKKNWDGGWSLLSAYYLGFQYTRQLNDVLGISLRRAFFITRNGSTACYFSERLKREFGETLAKRTGRDEGVISEWCTRLKNATDVTLSTLSRLESEDVSEAVFREYVDVLYEYGTYHRIIKVTVDYIDPEILSRHLESLTEARVYAEPVYEQTERFIRKFAEGLSGTHDIEPHHILAMTGDQFVNLLNHGIVPKKDVLERQNDSAVLFMEDGEARYLFGDDATATEKRMFHRKENGVIRGATAFRGTVTGKVRIILDATKEHVFDEGDILVTGMTRPEYLPFIRKSSGFVTDAGGLLSHAAISARELKKPCIIGTENATRILRDGDLVEVDADNGVVRKIDDCVITLSNIYSREKSLFYFTMWNDSNTKGYRDYLDHEVRNHLFIVKPAGKKGSVWYESTELEEIDRKIAAKLKDDPSFVSRLKERLDGEWKILLPYLTAEKAVRSGEELRTYYDALVNWWSAMNTTFGIPEMTEASKTDREFFLTYRQRSEKYTERMGNIFKEYWEEYFPEYRDMYFFVSPNEAVEMGESGVSDDAIAEIRAREHGVILLNEKLFPLAEMDDMLQLNGLRLETLPTDAVETIRGVVACKAEVPIVGSARVISSFKDMSHFRRGEILVTEMTNPDYVPIMKSAAAIVTDEGGVMCHASIASRELGIPCVIGTKIATKIIMTGDTIEVDTGTGTVKVREKKVQPSDQTSKTDLNRLSEMTPWEKTATRKTTMHRYFDFSESAYDMSRRMYGINLETAIFTSNDGEIEEFRPESEYKRYIDGFNDYFESERNARYVREHMVPDSEGFMVWLTEHCREDMLAILSDSELSDTVIERHERHQELLAWQWFVFAGKYAIEKSVTDRLESCGFRRDLIELILSMDEPIYMLKEDLEMKRMALDDQKGVLSSEELRKRIGDHLSSYGCFVMYDEMYPEMTENEASARIAALKDIPDLEDEIQGTLDHYARNKSAFKDFMTDGRLSDEDRSFFEFAHEYARFMELKNQYKGLSARLSLPLYEEIAKRLGTDTRSLLCFSDDEILAFIGKEHEFDEREAEKRYACSAVAYASGEIRVVTDPDKVDALKRIVNTRKHVDLIRGKTAFSGKVTGIVRIVNSIGALPKLSEGDVLVSSMTRPDFLVAIHKAAAIVTDEGGITCHAAIIARELKKPTVIGTKIATQVLRDGDLVEVDADLGVVRVVKRKNE